MWMSVRPCLRGVVVHAHDIRLPALEEGAAREDVEVVPVPRGLHSSTFELNISTIVGMLMRGSVACVKLDGL